MSAFGLLVYLVLVVSPFVSGSSCRRPPPGKNFTNKKYEGTWFEIGKIQTFGGAFFERNCVCTQLTYNELDAKTGNSEIVNACREKEVNGPWTNVTASLFNEQLQQPGSWQERVEGYNTGSANYTIIEISDDYAVEYDCTEEVGITNYCIHVLSRSRSMDQQTFNQLISNAEALDLNPSNLEVKMTTQRGC